jgi:hypothetical protein
MLDRKSEPIWKRRLALEWLWFCLSFVAGVLYWRFAIGSEWAWLALGAGLLWAVPCYLALGAVRLTVWAVGMIRHSN